MIDREKRKGRKGQRTAHAAHNTGQMRQRRDVTGGCGSETATPNYRPDPIRTPSLDSTIPYSAIPPSPGFPSTLLPSIEKGKVRSRVPRYSTSSPDRLSVLPLRESTGRCPSTPRYRPPFRKRQYRIVHSAKGFKSRWIDALGHCTWHPIGSTRKRPMKLVERRTGTPQQLPRTDALQLTQQEESLSDSRKDGPS